MADKEKIKKALSPKSDAARRKLHTEEVTYSRAHNGGYHARVARHTADGKHHHTEHHVVSNKADLAEHLDQHMGDQPDAGAVPMQTQAEPPEQPDQQGAGPAPAPDGGGGAAMPGM